MKELDIAEWVTDNVEPLLDCSTSSKLFRCSATLTDGVLLPCVIVRNKQDWVKLAMKRFEDCRAMRPDTGKNLLNDYPTIVGSFACGGNRINSYEVASVRHSPYAIPVERMQEINGETSMSWTQFTVRMKDGAEFEFGTVFNMQFFNMPNGYSGSDIAKIIPATRGTARNSGAVLFRERPFFSCFIDGI